MKVKVPQVGMDMHWVDPTYFVTKKAMNERYFIIRLLCKDS